MKIETGNTGMRAPLAAMFAWVAIGTSGCLAAGGGAPPALDPQVVHDWSGHARTVLQAETGNQDPLVGTRSLAMVHLAMHDAVNAVDRQYQPYAYATPNAQAGSWRISMHDPAGQQFARCGLRAGSLFCTDTP